MKELTDIFSEEGDFSLSIKLDKKEAFYKELKSFTGDTFYNNLFYGLNFVRKIDNYLSLHFNKERYEEKLMFAEAQIFKSSKIEDTAKEYKLQIEEEINFVERIYKFKKENIKESDKNLSNLFKEYEKKKEKFYNSKKFLSGKIKNFFNKFYRKFSLDKNRKDSKDYESGIDFDVTKLDYKRSKKRLKSSKKYLIKEFRNFDYLKDKLTSLYKEHTKIEGAIYNASLSKIFYKDYLVLSKIIY